MGRCLGNLQKSSWENGKIYRYTDIRWDLYLFIIYLLKIPKVSELAMDIFSRNCWLSQREPWTCGHVPIKFRMAGQFKVWCDSDDFESGVLLIEGILRRVKNISDPDSAAVLQSCTMEAIPRHSIPSQESSDLRPLIRRLHVFMGIT